MAGLLAEVRRRLADRGVPEAGVTAERLLMHVLGLDRGALFVGGDRPVDPGSAERIQRLTAERARRVPLQHVTGETEFYGRSFRCDRRALIPRPETEGLVDAALGLLPASAATIVDLGTGSGCIAWTLALERPGWTVRALERSAEALALAGENARRLGLGGRVELVAGDFGDPPAAWRGCDAVLSNPPYVREGDWRGLQPEVRDHDPREALVAGEDGLDAYRRLVPAAAELLAEAGVLILELGAGQADAVSAIVSRAGFGRVDVRPDLAGIPRVLCGRREGSA